MIVLLTDFGPSEYVGVMKGVILGIDPSARIVDLCHSISPQCLVEASWILKNNYAYFPDGSVFCCVVDPGVGSDRWIILGKYANRYVVAPDNGLVTLVHREFQAEAVHLVENRRFFVPQLSANSCAFCWLRAATALRTGRCSTSKKSLSLLYALEWARPMNP